MNNHSYVCVPANKLAAIIKESCPPIGYTKENGCFGADEDCVNCWRAWFKDGDSNG